MAIKSLARQESWPCLGHIIKNVTCAHYKIPIDCVKNVTKMGAVHMHNVM